MGGRFPFPDYQRMLRTEQWPAQLTSFEAALFLEVSYNYLRRLRVGRAPASPPLPAVERHGKQEVYDREALTEWYHQYGGAMPAHSRRWYRRYVQGGFPAHMTVDVAAVYLNVSVSWLYGRRNRARTRDARLPAPPAECWKRQLVYARDLLEPWRRLLQRQRRQRERLTPAAARRALEDNTLKRRQRERWDQWVKKRHAAGVE